MNEANTATISIANYIYTATVVSENSADSYETYMFKSKVCAEQFKDEREANGDTIMIECRPIWRYDKP